MSNRRPFLVHFLKQKTMIFENDNFEPDLMDSYKKAENRRHLGRQKQQDINCFTEAMESSFRLGETFDRDDITVLTNFMGQQEAPDMESLERYLESRGYTPDSNLINFCMQLAHARNEHIEEVMDMYEADNFGFGTAAGKARRKKRRNKRKGIEDEATPEAEKPNINDSEEAEKPNINDTQEDRISSNPVPPVLLNPSRDEAHAEIIGQEAENEEYDGEQDKLLPILTAAISLGKKMSDSIKEQKAAGKKIDVKSLANLFKKKANEVAGEVEASITKTKKKDFLRENAPLIIAGVVVLLIVGSTMK